MSCADLPLLKRWLSAPHVAEWWPDPEREYAAIERHMNEPTMELFIVRADERPIGYLQAYDLGADPDYPFGEHPPGSRGIDQLIGEPDMVNRGHGSAMIRAFVDRLLAADVPRVVTDPDPDNARAIRAYKKAGFSTERLVNTPFGRTLLMVRNA
jgi:aminoglycoside 6'-N-acetyltransferase